MSGQNCKVCGKVGLLQAGKDVLCSEHIETLSKSDLVKLVKDLADVAVSTLVGSVLKGPSERIKKIMLTAAIWQAGGHVFVPESLLKNGDPYPLQVDSATEGGQRGITLVVKLKGDADEDHSGVH